MKRLIHIGTICPLTRAEKYYINSVDVQIHMYHKSMYFIYQFLRVLCGNFATPTTGILHLLQR